MTEKDVIGYKKSFIKSVKNDKKCFTKGFYDGILTEPSMRYTAMKVLSLWIALIDLYTKIQDSPKGCLFGLSGKSTDS